MTATPQQPRGSLPLGILMGAIVATIVLVIVWFGAGLGDSRTATPAESPSPSPTPTETAPSPSPTPTPTPTTPSASPTPEETTPSAPVEGIVTELPTGSWVTVLKSLHQSSTTPEQALAQASELSRPGYQAVVLDTNSFGSLKPGYFAIVIPGATSSADVAATCKAIGIPSGDHCYPRQIKG